VLDDVKVMLAKAAAIEVCFVSIVVFVVRSD
jgi:hypothetical protein